MTSLSPSARGLLAASLAVSMVVAPAAARSAELYSKPPASELQTPRPSVGLEDLKQLAGTWQVAATRHGVDEGTAPAFTGRSVNRLGPGGRSVIVDFEATAGPFAGFAMHEIIAWDAGMGTAHLVWVDSVTPAVTMISGGVVGSEVVFIGPAGPDGALGGRESAIADLSPDSFTLISRVRRPDGAVQPSLTLRFTRTAD